jgi:hypothetical protein
VGVCVVLDRAPVDYPPLTRTADLIEVRGRRRSPPIGERMIQTRAAKLICLCRQCRFTLYVYNVDIVRVLTGRHRAVAFTAQPREMTIS